jgi:cytochrome c oxidase assembly protein subunit 15
LTAIHWTHRVGALITLVYLGSLAIALVRNRAFRAYGALLATMLAVQIALGIANILAGLPLAVAVSHNAAAAVLLVLMVVLNSALFPPRRSVAGGVEQPLASDARESRLSRRPMAHGHGTAATNVTSR